MKTTTNPERDALKLVRGRVPARADLDSLEDLFTAYRSAAIGSAPQPSAALSARVDLTATPIAMQRDVVAVSDIAGVGARRAVGGLFGLGVTVAIILGAASGAAAVVSMGTAGLLPPGAQGVFDQVVSDIVPLGVVGEETTDQGEAPGVPTDSTTTPEPTQVPSSTTTPGPVDDSGTDTDDEDAGPGDDGTTDQPNGGGSGNSGQNNGVGNSGEDNGFGNSGSDEGAGNGNSGNENPGNGNGNGNSGNGNSGNGNGNSGNGNSGNGNSGKKDG
jgi:hypothetical protein